MVQIKVKTLAAFRDDYSKNALELRISNISQYADPTSMESKDLFRVEGYWPEIAIAAYSIAAESCYGQILRAVCLCLHNSPRLTHVCGQREDFARNSK